MAVKKRQCRANRIAKIIDRSHLHSKNFNLNSTCVESIVVFYFLINTSLSFCPNYIIFSSALVNRNIGIGMTLSNRLKITSVMSFFARQPKRIKITYFLSLIITIFIRNSSHYSFCLKLKNKLE